MGTVDQIDEVLALVAVPARSGLGDGPVGIDADAEVVDRGQSVEIELAAVGERPVRGESEHLVRLQRRLVRHRGRRGCRDRTGLCRREACQRLRSEVTAHRSTATRARCDRQDVGGWNDRAHELGLTGRGLCAPTRRDAKAAIATTTAATKTTVRRDRLGDDRANRGVRSCRCDTSDAAAEVPYADPFAERSKTPASIRRTRPCVRSRPRSSRDHGTGQTYRSVGDRRISDTLPVTRDSR